MVCEECKCCEVFEIFFGLAGYLQTAVYWGVAPSCRDSESGAHTNSNS